MAKENLRHWFVNEIFPGECYLKGFYLQKSRLKNINIKNFSIINYDVYVTPDEIFEPFVETPNDLIMNNHQMIKWSNHEQRCIFEANGKKIIF